MKSKGENIYPHTTEQLHRMIDNYKADHQIDKAWIVVWRYDLLQIIPNFTLFETEEDALNFDPDVLLPFAEIGEC